MMKRIVSILLFITITLTGCAKYEMEVPYFREDSVKQYNPALQADVGVAEFYSRDLIVISLEDEEEDEFITATSSLLVNLTDNKVIYADDIYKRMYPASITKLITALVVVEEGNLEDTVTISKNATNILEPGALLCGFKEGDKINLKDLLSVFLIYSGNDAGIALAEHISGSEEEFVNTMNETVKRLGAVHSNFVNPHGLHDEEHYTTAYDLYLIFNEILKYDEIISIINQTSCTVDYTRADGSVRNHQFMNTNRYLTGRADAPEDITVIGGKTGTTQAAGNCLILYSVDNSQNEYISVVLQANGGNNLYKQMTYLLNKIE